MDAVIKKNPRVASAPRPVRRPSRQEAEAAVKTLIAWAGDDPAREGLKETPARVVDAYGELFAGYQQDPGEILNTTFGEVGGYDDAVVVRDIRFFTHCEHHMVPFFGHIHVAYLPRNGVVGLSKLVRLIDVFARRFQTQENLTAQIIDALDEHLNPRGAAIVVEAEHLCMSMRGVRNPGARTITHRFSGVFAQEGSKKDRLLALLGQK